MKIRPSQFVEPHARGARDTLYQLSALLTTAFALSGCALAELGGVEAGAAFGESAAIAEGAAAGVGEAAAMSRLGAAAGGAELASVGRLAAGEVSLLGRAAALRGGPVFGMSSALVEETAIVRSGAQLLTYPEEAGLARWQSLPIKTEAGDYLGSLRRMDYSSAIGRGRSNQFIGESVRRGNQIDHYLDTNRNLRRGFSKIGSDGMLRHWLLDEYGNQIFVGAEPIVDPLDSTPNLLILPASAIATANLQFGGEHRDERKSASSYYGASAQQHNNSYYHAPSTESNNRYYNRPSTPQYGNSYYHFSAPPQLPEPQFVFRRPPPRFVYEHRLPPQMLNRYGPPPVHYGYPQHYRIYHQRPRMCGPFPY